MIAAKQLLISSTQRARIPICVLFMTVGTWCLHCSRYTSGVCDTGAMGRRLPGVKGNVGKYHEGEKVGLVRKVVSEFDLQPGGVLLPRDKIGKHFEGERVKIIVLKIVRGLYFHDYNDFLPEDVPSVVKVVPPNERPPDHFVTLLASKPSMGQYPGVFYYKTAHANHIHYWAMLFWGAIIAIAAFHDPLCKCYDCRSPQRD